MKKLVQSILQKTLGFERYLVLFAKFKIATFKGDKNEGDFFKFVDMMHQDANVLDIGSNIGITAVHLARKVKKVYAYEPVPPNFKTLSSIIKNYNLKNVELFQLALGDDDTMIEMVMPQVENVQMQGLSHVVHEDLTEFNDGKRFKAPLKRLDDLDTFQNTKVHGIKLDVENFEYFALKGGERLILRDKPIIYTELWENENRYKCFDLVKRWNYSIKVLHNDELVDFEQGKYDNQNFFFV
ncbi:MAG: FkbM family methyltransferase [Saprospiraceae bacterium]